MVSLLSRSRSQRRLGIGTALRGRGRRRGWQQGAQHGHNPADDAGRSHRHERRAFARWHRRRARPHVKLVNKTKWALLTKFELIDAAVRNICIVAGAGAITDAVVNSTNPRGAGTFDVYVTGELETASVTDVANAQAAIDRYVFGSSATPKTALVFAAPGVDLNITGTVFYQGSYDPADLARSHASGA
jgi:hypothetical protein